MSTLVHTSVHSIQNHVKVVCTPVNTILTIQAWPGPARPGRLGRLKLDFERPAPIQGQAQLKLCISVFLFRLQRGRRRRRERGSR